MHNYIRDYECELLKQVFVVKINSCFFVVVALLKSGTKPTDTNSSNSTKTSFPGVVVKCETSDNDDESNFVDPASTSSRNYPDHLLTDEDQLVIPNLGSRIDRLFFIHSSIFFK